MNTGVLFFGDPNNGGGFNYYSFDALESSFFSYWSNTVLLM